MVFESVRRYSPESIAIRTARKESLPKVKTIKGEELLSRRGQLSKREQEELKKELKRGQLLAKGRKILAKKRVAREVKFRRTGFALGKRVAEFRPPQEDFSFQEQALRETFGRGEHIWGTEMKPVKIYNDLNPRQRGDNSTAELFGF